MDQHPGVITAPPEYPDQLVYMLAALRFIWSNLLQLGIEKLRRCCPVNIAVRLRKAEREKRLEILLQCLFPGTVEIGAE